jgi:hypothetical protein
LQVAVILLPAFAAALALGILMESWYDAKVAQQLVFGVWWFTGLLGLLWLNILFAAVKKWPWRKHQTGFLITHLGLLALVVGGIVNSLGGMSAQMFLVDSDSMPARNFGLYTSNLLIDRNIQMIRVRRADRTHEEMNASFEPGLFAWKADEFLQPQVDRLAAVLLWIAHPWPRSWTMHLGDDARLEVLGFYPHARQDPFGPASPMDRHSFPALKFELTSTLAGKLPAAWLADQAEHRSLNLGPGFVEFFATHCSAGQIAEFCHPPAGYQPFRPRQGDSLRALLQFAAAEDGTLYYRTFHTANSQGIRFEKSGRAEDHEGQHRIWAGMNWRLKIIGYFPRARFGPVFVPQNRRLGLEDEATPPALRCRLMKDSAVKEFWIGKTDGGWTPISVEGQRYDIGYNSSLRKLDFTLTLLRAAQSNDPGSSQPASQSSLVCLSDPDQGRETIRVITLNQPLSYGGYQFYQAGYATLGLDESGKTISRSVLVVARDPGLWLKYAGSTMLALGVACMFYMKAYFFGR